MALLGQQGSQGCILDSPGESDLVLRGKKGLRSPVESRRAQPGAGAGESSPATQPATEVHDCAGQPPLAAAARPWESDELKSRKKLCGQRKSPIEITLRSGGLFTYSSTNVTTALSLVPVWAG